MDIKPGQKYKLDYGKNNAGNKIIHILGIFDERYIAFKYYICKRWFYEIEPDYFFDINIKNEYMKKLKI